MGGNKKMNKWYKQMLVGFLAMSMMSLVVGCGAKEVAEVGGAESPESVEVDAEEVTETEDVEAKRDVNSITILGLGDEVTFNLDEVKAFEPFVGEINSSTSSGEIKTAEIKGTTLDDLLESKGLSKAGCDSMRIVASDGYEIAVPRDVLENKEIIIAYEQDGEAYDKDEFGAFRTIVPDERAMYWVRGTVELYFEKGETVSGVIHKIIPFENQDAVITYEDYTYYENVDKAIKIVDLIDTYANTEGATSGAFVAGDGLKTEQTFEILKDGYIKMTGENAPLFIAPEMPKGMQIKGVKYMNIGDSAFVSLKVLAESSSEEVRLQSILKDMGMTGSTFLVKGVDSETVLEGKALNEAHFVEEDGTYFLVTDEGAVKIEVLEIIQQ